MKQTRLQGGIIALMLITLTACNNDDDESHYNTDCYLTGQVYIPAESKYHNNDNFYGGDKIEIEEVSRNGNLLTVKTLLRTISQSLWRYAGRSMQGNNDI